MSLPLQEEEDGSDREDGEDGKEDEKARIAKYRALLAEGDDKDEDKPNGDVEMEITWGGVDLKEKTEELVKKKEKEMELTPWEKYIEKQKTKKKAKSAAQKEAAKAESSDDDSDSDIPSDLADDPFFKEEIDARRADNKEKKKKKTGKGKKSEPEEPDESEKAQLALLTMDDGEEDNRRHFDFKQIVKDETATAAGKKKKWKKKRKPAEEKAPADDFQVDVADPRFTKMFESAEFNVDPSDARFKPTEGMKRLVGEKQRRVAAGEARPADEESTPKKARLSAASAPAPAPAEDLGALVNAIKTKTKQLKKKKSKVNR
ncbi:ESF1 [Amphibalanus amphitrite]|uniref:ESF1 n=1 Tax=Amphibalanus amphitrite TaxID=1232801 RepID=A0A6A4VZN5_AMPAM|nr:ESF1 [Amphibalanus amphitrite]